MRQIRALFESWEHTNKDSGRISRKWDKVAEAIEKQKDKETIYPLIVEYAAATERRGFTAGFKAAMELCKECV